MSYTVYFRIAITIYMNYGGCRGTGRECNEEKDTVSPSIELFKVEEHCFGQSL